MYFRLLHDRNTRCVVKSGSWQETTANLKPEESRSASRGHLFTLLHVFGDNGLVRTLSIPVLATVLPRLEA
jgi:hypothetical protein